jgi:hypothetical protein
VIGKRVSLRVRQDGQQDGQQVDSDGCYCAKVVLDYS